VRQTGSVLPDLDAAPDTDLPVRAVLPEVLGALRESGSALLVAPPGSGKTTLVPLALAGAYAGRVVVAQPRRIAARAAARRMAALTGTAVGGPVGYTVRGESRTSPATRIEVVTTGVLVRRLQRDPELPGTGAVLLDECHERHLDTDLALAFLVDVRAALRPELALLAASATVDADRIARRLGDGVPVPVLTTPSSAYPTEIFWCPPPHPDRPAAGHPSGARVDPRLLDHVAATVRRAVREAAGDVLVFLPGAAEIAGVAGRLADLGAGLDLVPLHGRQPGRVQDAALSPGARRRVVLATAVAESSLTVPGVRIVVDAGLSREPRTDYARGMGSLVTVRVSQAAADQRAGRAGREGPGRVYRCWSAAQHERLPGHAQPEVALADLTGFALELACWGHPDGQGLALPDPPPPAAMQVAASTLRALGALDAAGRVTARGRLIAAAGTHPRLARALIDGAAAVGRDRAAQVVAVLADDTLAGSRDDLTAAWRRLRSDADRAASARWRDETRRLASVVGGRASVAADRTATTAAGNPANSGADGRAGNGPTDGPSSPAGNGPGSDADSPAGNGADGRAGNGARLAVGDDRPGHLPDDLAAGLLVGLAYPERLARARSAGAGTYLMAGGTAATLPPGSALAGTEWLAVAVADRVPGSSAANIRLAAPVDEATARQAAAPLLARVDEVGWADGDVRARRVHRLGAIVLSEHQLSQPERGLLTDALREGLRHEGIGLLRWDREARALRERLAFCHHVFGPPWPAVDDGALLDAAPLWLGAELARARRRADLERVDAGSALRRLLAWPQAARLDELAPERLRAPSGSRIRVDYADPAAPVLAVPVQEAFGWRSAPVIADGRVTVLLHLLSPAGRPVAVTSDLPSFWRTGYPQVRAELRGRYPRHPWPEDPTTAPPTRRTGQARR
jgi:ATP-dependent helicase HrpB